MNSTNEASELDLRTLSDGFKRRGYLTLLEYYSYSKQVGRHPAGVFKEIAEDCNCSQARISQIAHEDTRPSYELAVRIEQATGGLVKHDQWYPSPPRVSDPAKI